MMLFDTDIFIWLQRGNFEAASLIEKASERFLSVVSNMEFLQGSTEKQPYVLSRIFSLNSDSYYSFIAEYRASGIKIYGGIRLILFMLW